VEKGFFYGVQFHAEKSSAAGLRLLSNFAGICLQARREREAEREARALREAAAAPGASTLP
jgi:hypothetical protein